MVACFLLLASSIVPLGVSGLVERSHLVDHSSGSSRVVSSESTDFISVLSFVAASCGVGYSA